MSKTEALNENPIVLTKYHVPQRSKRVFRVLFAIVLFLHFIFLTGAGVMFLFSLVTYISIWALTISMVYFIMMVCTNHDTKPTYRYGSFFGLVSILALQTTLGYWCGIYPLKLPFSGFILYYFDMVHVYPFIYILVDFATNNIVVTKQGFVWAMYADAVYIVIYIFFEFVIGYSIYFPFDFAHWFTYPVILLLIAFSWLLNYSMRRIQKHKFIMD